MKISRQAYAEMFGPTVGDRVRLADTDLWIQVENDYTIYGEEVKFGGGKVIRDGMGQSQLLSAKVADTVITNALIIDHWGIVKADIGIKGGKIWKIGKAGNPDIQPAVTIPIGAGTEIIAGEGMIGLDRDVQASGRVAFEHMRIQREDGTWEVIAVDGGFLHVTSGADGSRVDVLADGGELEAEVDRDAARALAEQLEQRLSTAEGQEELEAELARAKMRAELAAR